MTAAEWAVSAGEDDVEGSVGGRGEETAVWVISVDLPAVPQEMVGAAEGGAMAAAGWASVLLAAVKTAVGRVAAARVGVAAVAMAAVVLVAVRKTPPHKRSRPAGGRERAT